MSKIYIVKWTSNAKDDLLNIVDYIKKDNVSTARKVYGQIKEKAQSSNFCPLRGRVVPELLKEGITIYRELIAQPWRIIYKIENDTVYIMAVFDSRQNVEELLLQKLLRGHIC
jgi:addiction module RelE/StbE family toxin